MISPFKIPLSLHKNIIQNLILRASWEGIGERYEKAVNDRIKILKEIEHKYRFTGLMGYDPNVTRYLINYDDE